jgi:hypothetical protein
MGNVKAAAIEKPPYAIPLKNARSLGERHRTEQIFMEDKAAP